MVGLADAQGDRSILIPETLLAGPSINSGNPVPATISFQVPNEDAWIVGVHDDTYLKMVKLRVTGANSYDWISTKSLSDGSYPDSCLTSFTESCFKGDDGSENFYEVKLVAELTDLKNTGNDCWNKCNDKQGPCSWCGSDGMCCTRKLSWTDKSNGCDGTIGGVTKHECVLRDIGPLWQMDSDNKYCEFHGPLIYDVISQRGCQIKCESNDGCVGITYSHDPNNKHLCYVCLADSLSPLTGGFAFYRRPVDCAWNEFGHWSACTNRQKPCQESGRKRRFRTTKIIENYGGKSCEGSPQETEVCDEICPALKTKMKTTFTDMLENDEDVKNKLKAWLDDKLKGLKGLKGDNGRKGDRGDNGNKGDRGNSGLKGDHGKPGPRGVGTKGAQGSKGMKGVQGHKGDKGDTGVGHTTKGQKGEKGNTGQKGQRGPKGKSAPDVPPLPEEVLDCSIASNQQYCIQKSRYHGDRCVGKQWYSMKSNVQRRVDAIQVCKDQGYSGVINEYGGNSGYNCKYANNKQGDLSNFGFHVVWKCEHGI